MNTITENRYKGLLGNAIPREAYFHPPRPPRGRPMDLRCPNCNSQDMKKVSVVYEEGVSRTKEQTRLRALLFGDEGPNVILGSAVTNGTRETELSKSLRPPKKWSYGKLLLWAGFVSVISLIFYIHFVMSSSATVSGLSAVVFGAIGLGVFVVLLLSVWRHNHLVYPRQYAEWDRSFICQRCGGVSQHGLPGTSLL